MSPKRLLTGDPGRTGLIYLAIGGVSLAKAIALRNDSQRFRRELADAALFIGVGLVLRRYATMRDQRREEIEEMIPNWVLGGDEGGGPSLGRIVRNQVGGSEEPTSSSMSDRARRMIAD